MNATKEIKSLPWPETVDCISKNQEWHVTVTRPVVNHERLLVLTFLGNPGFAGWRRETPKSFRLICSKKRKDWVVCYPDGTQKSKTPSFRTCYPEISEADEQRILAFTGDTDTRNHGMDCLDSWCETAYEYQKQRKKELRGEIEDEAVRLCPEELPAGLVDWILDSVLPDDKVMLYKKGNVRGTCFICREKVKAMPGQRFRQNEYTRCPSCGTRVACYFEGTDRFQADYVQNVAALQMGTDGRTLFIRQWHLCRDVTARWNDIPGQLVEIARYAMRGDKAAKWVHEIKEAWGCMQTVRTRTERWERFQGLQVYDGTYLFYPQFAAAAGTRLQYADLQGYYERTKYGDIIRYMLGFVRYPVYEFLWKAGYHAILQRSILGDLDRKAIRWQRKVLKECFKIPIRLLKIKEPGDWTLHELKRLTDLWEAFAGKEDEKTVLELFDSQAAPKTMAGIAAFVPLKQAVKYLRHDDRRAGDYLDYLKECFELKLDLTDRQVAFPPNLIAAHERTSAQVDHRKNKIMYEKFKKRAGEAETLAWQKGPLLIRPARSGQELKKEGSALRHCVGGYVEDMANGDLTIFFVRKADAPDTPFFTLDLRKKQIYQCRTTHNRDYATDPEVYSFVQEWLDTVVNKKNRRKTA